MMQNVTQAEIERRAYGIWEHEGRPQGRELEHWLRAEREILTQVSTTRTPKVESGRVKLAAKRSSSAGRQT
jgi:hypothetical protein